MQKLGDVWFGLPLQRQIIVAAATLGVFLAVLGLGRIATSPNMALLYAGLDPVAAGDVIQALEQRGIRYRVEGDAIFVPARDRDETRMHLAARSLPANGAAGYELLDSLSGFGTTAQMFDAAYLRAREGELARTIAASPGIRAARVHIAQASTSPFRRETAPRAAVTVTSATGSVSARQAQAMRFLIASAVPGLEVDAVSVIDAESGLVAGTATEEIDAAQDRSATLRRNAERLLEAHLGPGRAVVEVSIDLVNDSETIVERRIDPETRVAISTEAEERTRSASESGAQAVTVASNLPEGDAGASDGTSESRETETRERTNFEVSESQREIHRAPGAIRRQTVAVLVDGHHAPGADGTPEWRARAPEELETLRLLVASAVGHDEARGDVITVQSLRFEPITEPGTEALAPGRWLAPPEPGTLAALAALTVLALVLALFVLRPILLAARRGDTAPLARLPGHEAAAGQLALGGPVASEDALTGEVEAAPARTRPAQDRTDPAAGGRGAAIADEDSDPVARLRRIIAEREQESVEILRHWMKETGRSR
ncbi:MAG: flagellar M-ring protein FliF [Rhodobacteraceae bacterium]|nr:flagellar M-ring protein FliF [Paracoccaceae bacterium]